MYNEEIKYDSDFTKNSSTYNADEFFLFNSQYSINIIIMNYAINQCIFPNSPPSEEYLFRRSILSCLCSTH